MTKTVAVRPARAIVVPPGGFAGNAQQTGVTQLIFAKAAGSRGGRRSASRRRRKRKTASAPRRRRSSSRRSSSRLVKGSAAAKRHMARIRKMRRK